MKTFYAIMKWVFVLSTYTSVWVVLRKIGFIGIELCLVSIPFMWLCWMIIDIFYVVVVKPAEKKGDSDADK